jgi:uncharacterized repeat protein (TIGR03803 family)
MAKTKQTTRLSLLSFALAAASIVPLPAETPVETVLHTFAPGPPKGAGPYAGVISDAEGNLYGTTPSGGAWNQGVVYGVDPSGHLTVLYSFTGGADGANPAAGVIRDSAGNLYGTAMWGGAAFSLKGSGVVYKLDTAGQQTVLYTFTGGADGKAPSAGVIADSAGNLYGTTQEGGTANHGVVYKLDALGQETVLHSFGNLPDGAGPYGGVIQDSAGNLYGTTFTGGTGAGTVYELNPAGQETVLYTFTGRKDGGQPSAGVIRDEAGNLYGTTQRGGTTGYGVVFKLDTAGRQMVLYSFKGGADGGSPYAGVTRDSHGNLYGTTSFGGMGGGPCDAGCGVVYKVDTAGRETVLYTFPNDGKEGYFPDAGVIEDPAGNLYGTASAGGPTNIGVVYRLDSAGQQTVLYNFPNGTDGASPQAGVTRDLAGNFFGTTYLGGTAGAGTVFKIDTSGHETVLHNFTGGADGGYPQSRVILDSSGNIYGAARGGAQGGPGAGLVYKLDPAGQETVLYAFTGGADGRNPLGSLIFDSEGSLYGTTYGGGAADAGVVFKLDLAGQETVLYSFTPGADGHYPAAGVILDSTGNLYGTTYAGGAANAGVVYKVDSTGQETVLYSFTGGLDGGHPYAGVILDSNGNLYGTASQGGAWRKGVVYKVDMAGHENVLHDFNGGALGGNPYAGVILGADGNSLYGTTKFGGTSGAGVVYRLGTSQLAEVLYSFTGGADGGYPVGGVIFDPAGNLYGTTESGGDQGSGVVFTLTPD